MSGEPTPAQVANDLRAWARTLRKRRFWTDAAEAFERAAAAIDDLSTSGGTRRHVWKIHRRLDIIGRGPEPFAASADRAAGVLMRLWCARGKREDAGC